MRTALRHLLPMPLRGLCSFGAFPEGALEQLIAGMNAQMRQ